MNNADQTRLLALASTLTSDQLLVLMGAMEVVAELSSEFGKYPTHALTESVKENADLLHASLTELEDEETGAVCCRNLIADAVLIGADLASRSTADKI